MLFKRNNILKYINYSSVQEKLPLSERIFTLINLPVKRNGEIIYLMSREFRYFDNLALNYALKKSKSLNLPIRVIYKIPKLQTDLKRRFFERNFLKLKKIFLSKNIPFVVLKDLSEFKISLLLLDFNPLENMSYLSLGCRVEEIDGHNIIPARYISNKQEYSAMPFRIKVYKNIGYFLRKLPDAKLFNNEAFIVLRNFIENNLDLYQEYKNDPTKKVTSNLSPYINLGFISSYRIALEIIKSNSSSVNKEAFLEELIVRKELADNFCLHCHEFKSLECIPSWAKISIERHKSDFRKKIYTLSQFENAKTDENLWNSCQKQLLSEGKIEGYLRMYWAKMLLNWTVSVDEALKIAIFLNDKYALDAPSANGYVSILWSLAGLHDRAFADRDIYGKIRLMTFNGIKSKYNIAEYIEKYKT